YQSDIGLVGRSGDKYTVFIGGNILGTRLNFMLRDLVPLGQIVPLLVPLLEHFKQERRAAEPFGDYCHRLGVEKLQALLPEPAGKSAAGHGEAHAATPVAARVANGGLRPAAPAQSNGEAPSVAVQPDTRGIPLDLAPPEVTPAAVPASIPRKE